MPNSKNSICYSAKFADLDFAYPKVRHDTFFAHSYLHVPHKTEDTTHRVFPRHEKGDTAWVRETFDICGQDNPDGTPHTEVIYRADTTNNRCTFCNLTVKKWRPSIFMPRWASRIDLELVEDPKFERLQDITLTNIENEGILTENTEVNQAITMWIDLWNSINNNWDSNPFVLVYKFRVKHT